MSSTAVYVSSVESWVVARLSRALHEEFNFVSFPFRTLIWCAVLRATWVRAGNSPTLNMLSSWCISLQDVIKKGITGKTLKYWNYHEFRGLVIFVLKLVTVKSSNMRLNQCYTTLKHSLTYFIRSRCRCSVFKNVFLTLSIATLKAGV